MNLLQNILNFEQKMTVLDVAVIKMNTKSLVFKLNLPTEQLSSNC